MKFMIWQLPINHNRIFRSYDANNFDMDDYVPIWVDTCEVQGEECCENLFEKFNLEIPEHYAGHSLSVSDVITFTEEGTHTTTAYYCNSIGFTKIPWKPCSC